MHKEEKGYNCAKMSYVSQNALFQCEVASGVNTTIVNHGPLQDKKLSTRSSMGVEGATDDEASDYLELDEDAMLDAAPRTWEVPRENVIIDKIIGKGAFGKVAQGTVLSLQDKEEKTTVAIKMLKGNALFQYLFGISESEQTAMKTFDLCPE